MRTTKARESKHGANRLTNMLVKNPIDVISQTKIVEGTTKEKAMTNRLSENSPNLALMVTTMKSKPVTPEEVIYVLKVSAAIGDAFSAVDLATVSRFSNEERDRFVEAIETINELSENNPNLALMVARFENRVESEIVIDSEDIEKPRKQNKNDRLFRDMRRVDESFENEKGESNHGKDFRSLVVSWLGVG